VTWDEEIVGEALDPDGNRVVVTATVWRGKILKKHFELSLNLADVLRAINSPHHVAPDMNKENRRQHFLRGSGPSRWLMVVVSYEDEPARVVTAYPRRKDPSSWSR
jgi:hypothetical protein